MELTVRVSEGGGQKELETTSKREKNTQKRKNKSIVLKYFLPTDFALCLLLSRSEWIVRWYDGAERGDCVN